jgi:hypothetical protein
VAGAADQDCRARGTPPPGAGPLEQAAAGQAGGGAPALLSPALASRLLRREDGSTAGLANTSEKYGPDRPVRPSDRPHAELVARMLRYEEELQAAAVAST